MMEDVGKEMSKIIQKRDINERYEELVNEVLKDQDVQAFIQANRERLTDEDIRKKEISIKRSSNDCSRL